MATADKTRQQLLDSMRKSKSTATSKPTTSTRATAAKKTSPRRTATKPAIRKQQRPSSAAAMLAVTRQISNDPYQSTGRIWPD